MKSVAVHGLLALVGLSFAYQTWTRPLEEEQPNAEAVTLLDCDPAKVSALEIETQTHVATFRPERAGAETDWWITSQRKKNETEEAKKAEEQASAGASGAAGSGATPGDDAKAGEASAKAAADKPDPAAQPEPPKKKEARPYDPDAPVEFVANQKFRDLVPSLAPLRALRSLGELPEDEGKSFGFDDVTTFLRMECGGKKLELEVGGRTYGSGDRYVRAAKGKEVYLLNGKLVMDLQSAQYRFMQNALHDFELTDVDEAVVSALGKERRLLHRNRQVKEEARWVDAAAPDKRNELFGNWFERVGRLKARAYLREGQEPGADLQIEASSVQPVMTLEYRLEGKTKDKVDLVRVDTEQGAFYYARSNATKRWVTLYDSLAKQVEEDVPLVVGAEEPPAEPEPAAAEAKPAASAAPAAPELPAGHPPMHP